MRRRLQPWVAGLQPWVTGAATVGNRAATVGNGATACYRMLPHAAAPDVGPCRRRRFHLGYALALAAGGLLAAAETLPLAPAANRQILAAGETLPLAAAAASVVPLSAGDLPLAEPAQLLG